MENAGGVITITDYLDGYQYEKVASAAVKLLFFPHSEGYVSHTAGSYNYVFNYTDHLGNIRLSYTFDVASGSLKILEENNYYPYGMKQNNYNWSKKYYDKVVNGLIFIGEVPALPYKYKYNGKEYQDELGLNMTAMDMRMFDSAIARWVVQDPVIHHNQSMYNGYDGNPVYFADPSGAAVSDQLQLDYLNRSKSTNSGMYIAPMDRGNAVETDGGMSAAEREENAGEVVSKQDQEDELDQLLQLLKEILAGSPDDIKLLKDLYKHYQIGEKENFYFKASDIDVKGVTQKDLGKPTKDGRYKLNLFENGRKSQALAFGTIFLTKVAGTKDKFNVLSNPFDFGYEEGRKFARTFFTFLGGALFGNFFETKIYLPHIFFLQPNKFVGGKFDVIFQGTITIP